MSAPPPPPPPPPGPAPIADAPKAPPVSLAALLQTSSIVQNVAATGGTSIDDIVKGHANFREKSDTGFTGLANQGATCYLNSTLQSLFMIDFFRSILYNWSYTPEIDGPEEYSVPYHLQLLFGRLGYGLNATAGTRELTKSFGWEGNDAFRQHDVQELLTKLFEAVGLALTHGNVMDDTVPNLDALFRGSLRDYVCCTKCGYKRAREDPILDIQLPVKDIYSLEDAFTSFVTPELLEGDNQWFCEKCDIKVDASKGLEVGELPYFLMVQLKRFDYDYVTWTRIKRNHKITFPTHIDMTPWVPQEDKELNNEYELISILIHQGGAMGGHYFCITKEMNTGNWIRFNDAAVKQFNEEEIELMFGHDDTKDEVDEEGNTKPKYKRESTTNAYMLFYRRVVPKTDLNFPDPVLPEYIRKIVEEENQRYEDEKAEWIRRRDNLPLEVHFGDKTEILNIDKHKTIREATNAVVDILELENSGITAERIRIRKISLKTGTRGVIYEDLDESLDSAGFTKKSIITIDLREEDKEFELYQDSFVVFLVFAREDEEQNIIFEEEVNVEVPNQEFTLGEFKNQASEILSLPKNEIRTVQVLNDETHILMDDSMALAEYGFRDGDGIYVSHCIDTSDPRSIIREYFEVTRNKISLHYGKIDALQLDQELVIDQRVPLGELRDTIASLINEDPLTFVIKNMIGREYKDESLSLQDLNFYDGGSFRISKGKPMTAGQSKLSFSILDPISYEFGETKSTVIDKYCQVEELRALVKTLFEELSDIPDERLRLRVKTMGKAKGILYDGATLSESVARFRDGMELAIEVLEYPETMTKDQVIVSVVGYNQETQELTEPREIIFPKNIRIGEAKTTIIDTLSLDIPQQGFKVAKGYKYLLENKHSMATQPNWYVGDEFPLTATPWYMEDGDFLLYKDERLDDNVPQEIQNAAPSRMVSGEVGIKIYTPYDEEGKAHLKRLLDEKRKKEEPEPEPVIVLDDE